MERARPLARRIVRFALYAIAALVVLGASAGIFVLLTWDRPARGHPVPELTAPSDPATIARGEYLFQSTALCWSCHGAEGAPSSEPSSGGRLFDLRAVGPGFGLYYATNLTPDRETGLGAWSDGALVRALREGINREGRLIFPVMPYEWYHGMSDADALALVAYLRSVPPVRNAVPRPQPSFATKVLIAFGVLAPSPAISSPVVAPPRGPTPQYGKYLASHLAGCAECHTPRDLSNGRYDLTRPMGGGLAPFPEEGFSATGCNLTPDAATGIGAWSEAQFLSAMRQGLRPDGTVVMPFMPWPTYATWDENDLRALWRYLRSLEPVTHKTAPATLEGEASTGTGATRGKGLFAVYCATCHGTKGDGGRVASVVLGQLAAGEDASTTAARITDGSGGGMPGFGKTLDRHQIADLVQFLRALPRERATAGGRDGTRSR
jgi:mono/diheme cytochrome c family protein